MLGQTKLLSQNEFILFVGKPLGARGMKWKVETIQVA
jgi:hypothetical protein